MIRKIGLINRAYRHINRYKEIITVLMKHGFGDLIHKSNLEKHFEFGKSFFKREKSASTTSLSRWERVRMALEELGPTFVKFGQIMSNRPDLLPPKLLIELEKLQDSVPTFPEQEAKQVLEEQLGKPITTLFRNFESTPLASASIGQVHRATLMNGDEVVLKIQRPNIEAVIEVDLEIMLHFALLLEKYVQGMDLLNLVGIINEFDRAIRKEIDFSIEATHIERFGRNFMRDESIYVPKVYRKYTTKKVITMEFIDGIKISDIHTVRYTGNDPVIIADRGAELVLKQIFEHGFFHADPHPGNIMVLNNNIICFLDFGMMGYLTPKNRENLGTMIIGVINKDANKITKSIIHFSRNKHIEDIDGLESRLFELIEKYSSVPLKDIHMGSLIHETLDIIFAYKLSIPSDMYLLSKSLVTIEGVGRTLNPNFNMMKHIEPFAKKLLKERLSLHKLAKDVYASIAELGILMHDLPSELRDIIEQIKLGRVRLEFEHRGLEPMLKKHDQISNRIAFSIVLASLIIGSSLIVLSEIPPRWNDIPIIGIIGFLGAGIMGFWLLISILRHGRM